VLTATGDVARVHANFARHLTEMPPRSARLRPAAWDRALAEFLRRVRGTGLDWFLSERAALIRRALERPLRRAAPRSG
jgi:hypothetical protein